MSIEHALNIQHNSIEHPADISRTSSKKPSNSQLTSTEDPIRRALCPGRVRSGHDPLSHVPGLCCVVLFHWIFLIRRFLGALDPKSVLPVGYLLATCWLPLSVAAFSTIKKRRDATHVSVAQHISKSTPFRCYSLQCKPSRFRPHAIADFRLHASFRRSETVRRAQISLEFR